MKAKFNGQSMTIEEFNKINHLNNNSPSLSAKRKELATIQFEVPTNLPLSPLMLYEISNGEAIQGRVFWNYANNLIYIEALAGQYINVFWLAHNSSVQEKFTLNPPTTTPYKNFPGSSDSPNILNCNLVTMDSTYSFQFNYNVVNIPNVSQPQNIVEIGGFVLSH